MPYVVRQADQKAEDENDDEDENDWGRKEASRKSHTRVVAMLTRLIDRFDADGTRHRGSGFPSSASPIVLVVVVVLVLDLFASAKAGAFHFERNDITIICGTLRLKPWAELFCPFG